MAEVIAKATDVEVIYGDKPALDKINMSVKKGDIYALIGKNGAGKTTLLRLFTGQNAPDYGNIELFGKKGTHGLNEARKEPVLSSKLRHFIHFSLRNAIWNIIVSSVGSTIHPLLKQF